MPYQSLEEEITILRTKAEKLRGNGERLHDPHITTTYPDGFGVGRPRQHPCSSLADVQEPGLKRGDRMTDAEFLAQHIALLRSAAAEPRALASHEPNIAENLRHTAEQLEAQADELEEAGRFRG